MSFCLHIPQPPVCDFVLDIFYYEEGKAAYDAEKLLPDNTVYLIINFTDDPKKLFHDVSLQSCNVYKKAWISGMQRRYIVIEATNNNRMMVVRFKPGMAYPVLGIPIHSFSDTVLESDEILANELILLREELWNITEPAEKCRRMEQFLRMRLLKGTGIHPAVSYLINTLLQSPDYDIRGLIQKTGYSHKHILHLFDKYVGLTPKYFARVHKFQDILKTIEAGKTFSWTSLAHDYGFYDQAHFINDFRHFSGINPSAYMVEKTETLNYLPVHYTKA